MKIALVILHADRERGGAERYTVDLAAALQQRGHAAHLVSSSFTAAGSPPTNVAIETGRGSRARRYERFLNKVDAHVAGERYDVVHAMLPVRTCDIYHPHAGLAADAVATGHLKYHGPVLQTVSRLATQLNRRRQRFAQVERALLGGAHPPLVLCLSNYVKQTVRRHYPLEERLLPVLINAVDLHRFDPAARPECRLALRQRLQIHDEQSVFLMIAQDFRRKGLAEAIKALARLDDRRAVLVVAGRDDDRPYQRLAAQHAVSDRVIFAGPTTDPYSYYAAADAFVLPTRHDPCSLVVLEALAMGLPVISTTCNGATEVMTDGVHGSVLADPKDVAALAQAMQQLLDPAHRQAMRQACIDLRPRLAYDTHVQQLLQIYQRVVSERDVKR